jgi:hypothetical protein
MRGQDTSVDGSTPSARASGPRKCRSGLENWVAPARLSELRSSISSESRCWLLSPALRLTHPTHPKHPHLRRLRFPSHVRQVECHSAPGDAAVLASAAAPRTVMRVWPRIQLPTHEAHHHCGAQTANASLAISAPCQACIDPRYQRAIPVATAAAQSSRGRIRVWRFSDARPSLLPPAVSHGRAIESVESSWAGATPATPTECGLTPMAFSSCWLQATPTLPNSTQQRLCPAAGLWDHASM